MLLDRYLPDYDAVERHAVVVNAPPERVFAALHSVSAADLPLFRFLMTLRALPAALLRGRRPAPTGRETSEPLLEALQGAGFLILEEHPGRKLVAGVVGRFWRLSGTCGPRLERVEDFRRFATPGFARAVLAFWIEPLPGDPPQRVRLSTETRVQATDDAARQRFARYWRVISAGSALIRREWLRAIKRRAEAVLP